MFLSDEKINVQQKVPFLRGVGPCFLFKKQRLKNLATFFFWFLNWRMKLKTWHLYTYSSKNKVVKLKSEIRSFIFLS